jgi:tetratricopeptide (TPR) repeat protein
MEKLRQAFRLARLHHRPERIAEALQSLGWLYHLKRRYHLASRLQRMSLQYWRQAGNPYREAICLGRFALISQRLGRYEEARACYERSIALLEVFQDDAALGIVFSNYMLHAKELAIGAQNGEEKANLLNAAHDRGMEALKCCLAVGDESRLGVVFYELGCVEIKRQDYNKAREHLQQGLTPLERSGETGKFLECLLFLLWLGINSQQIPREICPGMMSLLVYISETRSRNGMQWIGSVDEVYRSIHGMLEGRLNDQQKRQARREGRQLERTTATMLAKTLL